MFYKLSLDNDEINMIIIINPCSSTQANIGKQQIKTKGRQLTKINNSTKLYSYQTYIFGGLFNVGLLKRVDVLSQRFLFSSRGS